MKKKYPYKVLSSLKEKGKKTMWKVDEGRKEQLIREDMRVLDEKEEDYLPIAKNFKSESKINQIFHKNKKKYVCSRDEVKKMAILSEEFRTNLTTQVQKLEKYYFDTRNQTLFYQRQ